MENESIKDLCVEIIQACIKNGLSCEQIKLLIESIDKTIDSLK